MAKILAVGIATVDIVSEVDCYPEEDTEVRALAHSVRRGGNATNTLVVLSQLGHRCTWAGVLADDASAAVVMDELRRYDIDSSHCPRLEGAVAPVSCITISRATGSRTIVHYRDLPEFDAGAFERIPLGAFDWLHFEGRNIGDTLRMVRRARNEIPNTPISLEVEKVREGIEELFPLVDLMLFSEAFAKRRRLEPAAMLSGMRSLAPQADMVCSLGERGATGVTRAGVAVRAQGCGPPRVVDTLGAGDVFNAGMIDALQRGAPLEQAMQFACALAGAKCARSGLHGLEIPARSFGGGDGTGD